MQIAPKTHAGFNRDAREAQNAEEKKRNDEFRSGSLGPSYLSLSYLGGSLGQGPGHRDIEDFYHNH